MSIDRILHIVIIVLAIAILVVVIIDSGLARRPAIENADAGSSVTESMNIDLKNSVDSIRQKINDMSDSIGLLSSDDNTTGSNDLNTRVGSILFKIDGISDSIGSLGSGNNTPDSNDLSTLVGSILDRINDISDSIGSLNSGNNTTGSNDLNTRVSSILSRINDISNSIGLLSSDNSTTDSNVDNESSGSNVNNAEKDSIDDLYIILYGLRFKYAELGKTDDTVWRRITGIRDERYKMQSGDRATYADFMYYVDDHPYQPLIVFSERLVESRDDPELRIEITGVINTDQAIVCRIAISEESYNTTVSEDSFKQVVSYVTADQLKARPDYLVSIWAGLGKVHIDNLKGHTYGDAVSDNRICGYGANLFAAGDTLVIPGTGLEIVVFSGIGGADNAWSSDHDENYMTGNYLRYVLRVRGMPKHELAFCIIDFGADTVNDVNVTVSYLIRRKVRWTILRHPGAYGFITKGSFTFTKDEYVGINNYIRPDFIKKDS